MELPESKSIKIKDDINFQFIYSDDEFGNYYGSLSTSIENSKTILNEFIANTENEENCWGGPESEVTLVSSTSTPSVLLFKIKRLHWIIDNLKKVLNP